MNLSETLERLADLLDAHGELAWQRCQDWTTTGRMPSTGERGGGTGAGQLASDDRIAERAGDRQAAAYWDELNERAERLQAAAGIIGGWRQACRWRATPGRLALACRLAAPHATHANDRVRDDAERIIRIIAICCPQRPKHLANRELLGAQIAADGWCLSCWRDNKFLEPVATGKYRDRCRACGDWRGVNGQDPPLFIVEIRHKPGGRVTTADVERALGRSAPAAY